jgi:hypothetical protein
MEALCTFIHTRAASVGKGGGDSLPEGQIENLCLRNGLLPPKPQCNAVYTIIRITFSPGRRGLPEGFS